jgi:hypothetical protein
MIKTDPWAMESAKEIEALLNGYVLKRMIQEYEGKRRSTFPK